jgi:thiol:disulfide interchange protein
MRRISILPVVFAFAAPFISAQDRPKPATDLIQQAQVQAAASGKQVFVAFHASWCSWCKRLDKVLGQPEVKQVMDRHFVFQGLSALEAPATKDRENPGANALYHEWTKGKEEGIPFYGFLDGKGKLLATSIRPLKASAAAENIAYPGSAEEIDAFLGLLKEVAPSFTGEELATLRKAFDEAKPKGH